MTIKPGYTMFINYCSTTNAESVLIKHIELATDGILQIRAINIAFPRPNGTLNTRTLFAIWKTLKHFEHEIRNHVITIITQNITIPIILHHKFMDNSQMANRDYIPQALQDISTFQYRVHLNVHDITLLYNASQRSHDNISFTKSNIRIDLTEGYIDVRPTSRSAKKHSKLT